MVSHPLPFCFSPSRLTAGRHKLLFSASLSALLSCFLSLYVFCLSSSGTLHTPRSLYRPPSPYLTSRRALQSRLHSPPPHLPSPPLPPRSPDMDKFIPVFSLTKRPSVSDTDCLGNHRAPVTLSHLSMSRTIMHTHTTHTHTSTGYTHMRGRACTHTDSRGRFKELSGVLMRKHIAACLRAMCMYVTEVSLHFCPAACI